MKHRAILTTAYAAGMRVFEACKLQICDIDSKRMVIHLREGKNKRDRYVMLGEQLLLCLRQYYRMERPQGRYLFPGKIKDVPISTSTVQQALRKAADSCGIRKKVTPHSMRHAFATHLLEMGTDIRVIQSLLGHRSIRTTTIYTQVSKRHVASTRSPLDVACSTTQASLLG
jgi:site-specific recombinase XerD